MKKVIHNDEIYDLFKIHKREFPKYTTQILNLANQNSQGTRPKVVGQLSDLIQEFEGNTFEEWIDWYKKKRPRAISNACSKIKEMVVNLKTAINLIDDKMISDWVNDLVLNKTYFGLKIQDIILKKIENDEKLSTRLATAEEESKNIDGFIDNIPVQIKPITYKQKRALPEEIDIDIIYYEKKKTKIEYDLPEKFCKKKYKTF